MNNVLKINFLRRKKLTSLLGLALDGSRLEGVVLRRTNGSLQLQQALSVTLSLDPLTAAPELVGREIRNHLDAAGVRERRCVVGVPLKWTLTARTELPPLPEVDAASLLQLEAERGFPCDTATLRLVHSRCPLPAGKQHVTLAGIPNSQLAALEQVLAAAKLKPVSFSPGITALQPAGAMFGVPPSGGSANLPPKGGTPNDNNGVLALAIGESQVSLQITCGGGVAALRALEGAIENEGSRRTLHTGVVAREARITLGQLPDELRESVRRIRIFGPRDLAQQLADEMELRFEPMGLSVEVVTAYSPDEFGVQLPPEASVSPAFSLAARLLAGQAPVFEFLPPKPTAWQQITTKYSSSRLRSAGAVAAGVVVIAGGLFLFQEWQLVRLRSQWSAMSAQAKELDGLQQQIRQYRPWFDDSFHSLAILRQLTTAFPEDGAVTAKTVEIHEGNMVNCSGTARDNAALLRTLSQLRAADGVTGLKVDQIRGKSPMQFTFDFHWGKGGGNEN
jgi:Tfp pilus assembly protein PilN